MHPIAVKAILEFGLRKEQFKVVSARSWHRSKTRNACRNKHYDHNNVCIPCRMIHLTPYAAERATENLLAQWITHVQMKAKQFGAIPPL